MKTTTPTLLLLALTACAPDVRLSSQTTQGAGGSLTGSTSTTTDTNNTAGAGGTSTSTTGTSTSTSSSSTTTTTLDATNDPHNCGFVGHDCLGGACVNGACQAVLLRKGDSQGDFPDVVVDSTHLYWTPPIGAIERMPLPSGPMEVILPQHASAILVDATNLVWGNAKIGWQPKAGGAPQELDSCVSCRAGGVALHAGRVAWLSGVNLLLGSLDEGTSKTASDLLFLPGEFSAIALDDTHLYLSAQNGPEGVIYRTPLDGGPPEPLGPCRAVSDIVLDDTHVYWINEEALNGVIVLARVPKAGGEVLALGASGLGRGVGIALDDTHVYWADAKYREIYRVPKTGGPKEVVVTGYHEPRRVAVTPQAIYWTYHEQNISEVGLMMLAR